MTKLSQVASSPPTPPPRSSLLILLAQALLFTILWNPVPSSNALGATLVTSSDSTPWIPPVPHAEHADLLRPFVAPDMPWSAAHRGLDIGARDDDIVAPADGEVMFVGRVVDRHVVTIRHADGLLSSFEPVESQLEVGTIVAQGDLLGSISADPDHCAVHCVHWGVREPNGWQIGSTVRDLYIDPGFLLGWTEPSILWPIHSDPGT